MKNKIVFLVVLGLFVASGVFLYFKNIDTLYLPGSGSNQAEYARNNQGGADVYVYETDAESAEDCTTYEKYDSENKVCYFECVSEEECAKMEDDIDAEISGWLDDEQGTENFSESGTDVEKTITSEYKITQGEKATLISGQAGSDDSVIWKHISTISPDTISNTYIESFTVFNDPENDTLAFVDDEDEDGTWRVGVNLAGYKNSTVKERNLTIVHELGHIVTLNRSQVKNSSESTCKNYFTSEGCANGGSYLHNFVKNFWKVSDVEKSRAGGDVYVEGSFVTEYAASEPEEDLAESFAYFVLDNKTNGTKIKDKKTAFFYNYPELVQIRELMRQGVYSDVVRARR